MQLKQIFGPSYFVTALPLTKFLTYLVFLCFFVKYVNGPFLWWQLWNKHFNLEQGWQASPHFPWHLWPQIRVLTQLSSQGKCNWPYKQSKHLNLHLWVHGSTFSQSAIQLENSWPEKKAIESIRDQPYITSSIGLGGFRKWQFLLTFSTVFIQIHNYGHKRSKDMLT